MSIVEIKRSQFLGLVSYALIYADGESLMERFFLGLAKSLEFDIPRAALQETLIDPQVSIDA